jgi:hypothetical protein
MYSCIVQGYSHQQQQFERLMLKLYTLCKLCLTTYGVTYQGAVMSVYTWALAVCRAAIADNSYLKQFYKFILKFCGKAVGNLPLAFSVTN